MKINICMYLYKYTMHLLQMCLNHSNSDQFPNLYFMWDINLSQQDINRSNIRTDHALPNTHYTSKHPNERVHFSG